MARLFFYLLRSFTREAVALFLAAFFLVWITQALRLFDLITAKGQSLLTLIGQAFLTTPALGKAVVALCVGIGIVRTMQAMQQSRELHTIHAARRLSALWSALAVFIFGGALAISLIANVLEPMAGHQNRQWVQEIAADLLGRTLEPGRFSEIVPGFVISIGGREANGTITGFFADDRRDPDEWRTYTAGTAIISSDESGYYVQLRDGSLQFKRKGEGFTQVDFSSYELALDRISTERVERGGLAEKTSLAILAEASGRALNNTERAVLDTRLSEAARTIAIGLLMAALSAFPHARRGRTWLPLEIVVLALTLGERVVYESLQLPVLGRSSVAVLLMVLAGLILAYRLQGYRLRVPEGAKA